MLMQRCKDNSFFLFISRFENQEIVDKRDTYPFFFIYQFPKTQRRAYQHAHNKISNSMLMNFKTSA